MLNGIKRVKVLQSIVNQLRKYFIQWQDLCNFNISKILWVMLQISYSLKKRVRTPSSFGVIFLGYFTSHVLVYATSFQYFRIKNSIMTLLPCFSFFTSFLQIEFLSFDLHFHTLSKAPMGYQSHVLIHHPATKLVIDYFK